VRRLRYLLFYVLLLNAAVLGQDQASLIRHARDEVFIQSQFVGLQLRADLESIALLLNVL